MGEVQIKGSIPCTIKKGSRIITQDEKIPYIYYLTEGLCYRSYINEEGEESLFGYLKEGSYVGALALLVNPERPISNSNIIAKTDCKGFKVTNEVFLKTLKSDHVLMEQLLQRAIREIVEVSNKYVYMKDGKIANRVCQLLLEAAEGEGSCLKVPKSFNYTEQAKLLGVHQVTVARIIKQLKIEGIIEKTKAGMMIRDREQLKKYSEGEKMQYR